MQLTSQQLSEWEAYDRLEPIGGLATDYRMAIILSEITNLFRWAWGKEGAKRSTPMDFFPDWYGEKEKEEIKKQTPEEMKHIMLGIPGIKYKHKKRK